MRFNVIKGRELTAALTQRWTEIQESCVDLASPYFRPEFTEHVAAVRDDVSVGVLEDDDGRIVGFFPFHRRRGGIGRPIGLGLSDYHGVISEPDAQWTVEDLLGGCGLVRYEFDHLPATQSQFAASHRAVEDSPIIALAGGYESFETSRDKAGRKQLREIERKRARCEEEVGPIEFVRHTADVDVLHTLMDWKSDQCQRSGTVDYFSLSWCRGLIECIHANRGAEFGGILSCLYADGSLAAAHFVMRSRRVWHSWFPVYNHEFHAYSPGLILLLEMIRAAADEGVEHIDLGKDISTYKKRFMTSAIQVAEGCAEVPSLLNSARHLRDRAEQWSRSSIFRPVLRIPGRVVKSIERRRRYE